MFYFHFGFNLCFNGISNRYQIQFGIWVVPSPKLLLFSCGLCKIASMCDNRKYFKTSAAKLDN